MIFVKNGFFLTYRHIPLYFRNVKFFLREVHKTSYYSFIDFVCVDGGDFCVALGIKNAESGGFVHSDGTLYYVLG